MDYDYEEGELILETTGERPRLWTKWDDSMEQQLLDMKLVEVANYLHNVRPSNHVSDGFTYSEGLCTNTDEEIILHEIRRVRFSSGNQKVRLELYYYPGGICRCTVSDISETTSDKTLRELLQPPLV